MKLPQIQHHRVHPRFTHLSATQRDVAGIRCPRIPSTQKQQYRSMFDCIDAGFTTWDLADHYGPAEDFIGEFRRQLAD